MSGGRRQSLRHQTLSPISQMAQAGPEGWIRPNPRKTLVEASGTVIHRFPGREPEPAALFYQTRASESDFLSICGPASGRP
jgi:hypothetical protein